jgi:hypothetical protein
MRGIGRITAETIGMAALAGAMDTVFNGYGYPTNRQPSYGTGWRDKRFRHPEGPCSYKPTGNKRTRRRNAEK